MAESNLKRPLIETSQANKSIANVHGVSFVRTSLQIMHCLQNFLRKHGHSIAIALGPFAAALVLGFVSINTHSKHHRTTVAMLAVLIWMIIWWVTEAVPIAITSLLPLLLYPVLGIQNANAVATSYMNDTVSLFIGSFILALAVERYQVHRRLALTTLLLIGGQKMDPRLLLLGFCIGPAFVSMWISNTATAIMMMPIAIGVLEKLQATYAENSASEAGSSESPVAGKLTINVDDLQKRNGGYTGLGLIQDVEVNNSKIASAREESKEEKVPHALKVYGRGVVLAVTYAVSIGGLTTLTGTGTNLVLTGMWSSRFPHAPPVSYLKWFLFAFPLGVVLLIFCWALICIIYCPPSVLPTVSRSFKRSTIQEEVDVLGPMSFAEKAVLGLFGVLILLWMTRDFSGVMPGWGVWCTGGLAGDGTASILMAIPLFIIPNKLVPGEKLMSWKHCKNFPWDIVLLLGGGFAIADGISKSGLSGWMTQHLVFLHSAPYLLMVPIVALFVGITTEFVSNASTATIFIPLLIPVALSAHIHPLFYLVPATITASYAFMLPIGTPPNAVAYATGYIRMIDMISTGFFLKVFATLVLSAMMPALGPIIFGLNKPFHAH
ncbi:hypothetical protein O6H91_Y121400 [Diphasiastrum complanatum]|nr:hypothetical protein O6H91_Y121400 [Diphasiastrum complanatum]KAJ7296460.1 hypothetical protein O6H91_Y121400 [Diphasiastrum complanatum]KAJ7296461.1 hypothetical protein O6H91_Y121400 [Diphasiastrum complanatum]KAJ7296462.1 hypothetical protein O6H91_Y121400 [Diphasiastrum complanatum]KAJ7296463.1 hypothetical protein O6H91_Y121400 [Diphasiastrum complanatum]